ncbi:hypothetical protein LCGC14_0538530 [marine sediment metagenome]|uniref:Uncharacterized protein n=1 Tax=marine sediment metagenome TaxID=412755 RepID=A0A0F9V1N6_9ZZZZ
MRVDVNMKKIVALLVLLAVICGGVWWYADTAPQRKAKAEIETMINFVQRQALEIAIIEQSSKLQNYKRQIAENQKAQVLISEPEEGE